MGWLSRGMMNMEVLINNLQERVPLSPDLESLLSRVAEGAVTQLAAGVGQRPKSEAVAKAGGGGEGGAGELSIALVDDDYIRRLNHTYRNLDEPTDVLSFPMDEEGLLGDVVISLERAEKQAADYGHSFQREVAFLLVHGILHLFGYDHDNDKEQRKMRDREEAILAGLGLVR